MTTAVTDRPGAPSSWRPAAVFFDFAGTLCSDKAAGCSATDMVFVGDSLRHDVEGPAAMGMRTAWMVDDGVDFDPGNIRSNLVVRRPAEVTYLVGVDVGR
jgi:ribonucleotide monophosphatase NagD (HAD superfamily)